MIDILFVVACSLCIGGVCILGGELMLNKVVEYMEKKDYHSSVSKEKIVQSS